MGLRTFFGFCLLLTLTTACGDDTGPAAPTPGNVSVETANAVSDTVGLSGGTLTTTAADGTEYTLEIPAGALAAPTAITMTPVRAIEGFPVLDSLIAGLEFAPSGLAFAHPARLTIASGATAGTGEFPIALGYAGDAAAFTVGFAAPQGGEIVVLVSHFSGFGLGFGTEEDMGALLSALPATPDAQVYAIELLLAFEDDPTASAVHAEIMRRWFTELILPSIEAAANDGELLTALADFNFWRSDVPALLDLFFAVETEFAAEINQAREAFIPQLQAAVAGNNALCEEAHNLDALRNVIFWQQQAGFLSLDTPANGLDAETVRADLCAEMVIEGASLPEAMQVGYPHSLDFRLLMKFSDGTTLDVASAVSIAATNAAVDNPTGFTDPFGHYTTVITATSNDAVEVVITGNVILPGETVPSIIEGTFFLNSAAGMDLTGSYVGVVSYANGFQRIVHTGSVTQSQNGISGTFAAEAIDGSFTATLTSEFDLVNASLTVNGSPLTTVSAYATDDGGSTAINYSASGAFPFDGGTVSGNFAFSLTGPNCAFENLDESGNANQYSYMKLRRPGNEVETIPITGWASITASSASITFTGGGISGSLTGSVERPVTGIATVTGTLSLCGQEAYRGAFVTNYIFGLEFYMLPGLTCPDEGVVTEVRFRIDPSAGGLGVFCR